MQKKVFINVQSKNVLFLSIKSTLIEGINYNNTTKNKIYSLLRATIYAFSIFLLSGCNVNKDDEFPPENKNCVFIFNDKLQTPSHFCLNFDKEDTLSTGKELYGFSRRYTNWYTHPVLVDRVNQLTIGLSDPLDKVKAIANWVKRSRPYSPDLYSPVNANAELEEIINAKTGICFDASFLSTAMLRIAGIPAFMNFVGINHANTAYKVNGKWRVFDATFCNDPNSCPELDFTDETINFPRINFLHQPAGSFSANNKYCENSICMPYPFTTNRILPIAWQTEMVQVVLPALSITSNQEIPRDGSRGQFRYMLMAKNLVSDNYGGYFDSQYDEWGLVDVGYNINRLQNGYMYVRLPVNTPEGYPIKYRFQAYDVLLNRLIAYHTFSLTNSSVIITWDKLEGANGVPSEQVLYAREELRDCTEKLGIQP